MARANLMLLLALATIATTCALANDFKLLFAKLPARGNRKLQGALSAINKQLCANVESEDPEANIMELEGFFLEREVNKKLVFQLSDVDRLLSQVLFLEKERRQDALCGQKSLRYIIFMVGDLKREIQLGVQLDKKECSSNRLMAVIEHLLDLHSKQCTPGIWSNYELVRGHYTKETELNMIRPLARVTHSDFNVREPTNSEEEFNESCQMKSHEDRLQMPLLKVLREVTKKRFKRKQSAEAYAALKVNFKEPCRGFQKHFNGVFHLVNDLSTFQRKNFVPEDKDTSEFYNLWTIFNICEKLLVQPDSDGERLLKAQLPIF